MVRSQPSFRGGRFASSRGGRGGDRGGRGGDWGGRGGGRGGRSFGRGRGGGRPSGPKVWLENHRFPGIFMAKGQLDAMVTLNLAPTEKVYQEKLIQIQNEAGEKIEYRVWNPYKSKIAAALLGGVDLFGIAPGVKVLYLGAASGTTVSHVADIVGLEGGVYAVEFSQRSGRDLVNMAKKRPNVIPIIEDARQPQKYRMIVPCVDVLFADVAQPDQARILGLNAEQFLKRGGLFMISIKANCVDSTKDPNLVFKEQIEVLKSLNFIPKEMVTLDPYEIDHAVVTGYYQVEQ